MVLGMPALSWHAHEMVFGYCGGVIAGFLLTAVTNWTGRPTLHGWPLAGLALVWWIARVAICLPGSKALVVAVVANQCFGLGLCVAVSRPIFQVKQWRQLGVLSKLYGLVLVQGIFFASVFGLWVPGYRWGLYGGVFLVLGLVIMIGHRVVPFFSGNARQDGRPLRQSRALDRVCLVAFLVLMLVVIAWPGHWLGVVAAGVLALGHSIRLQGWYHEGVRRTPLLWLLFAGWAFVILGFVCVALGPWLSLSPFVSLHAWMYGGVGLFTFGMMARVSLGHTGRGVQRTPRGLATAGLVLVLGACARVVGPAVDPTHVHIWIVMSQVAWLVSFAWLIGCYWRIWYEPRVDGKPG